jgi:hypothetical protein
MAPPKKKEKLTYIACLLFAHNEFHWATENISSLENYVRGEIKGRYTGLMVVIVFKF